MMKRFALTILGLLLAFVLQFSVSAQTTSLASPSPVASTQAALPLPEYRGLLPNHPLYKIKLLWNRLTLIFTPNPSKKAEKYLSLASSELSAAHELIKQGDTATGVHSAFRGEHYMTLLVNELKNVAYASGSLDTRVTSQAHAVYPSHQAIIMSMIEKTTGDAQNSLKTILEFSQRNDKELTALELEFSSQEKSEL